MRQTFHDRAAAAADAISEEDALKYLEEMRESWEGLSKNLSRSTVFYLLTAGLFELLIGSGQDLKASIAGFQFTNSETLQKALPVVSGYLFYDVVVLVWRWFDFEDVFRVFWVKFRRDLYVRDMEVLLKPSSGIMGIGHRHPGEGPLPGFARAAQAVFTILFLLVLPIAFFAHSAFLLIQKFGGGDPLVVVSISLSGLFTMYGLVYTFLIYKEDKFVLESER
ncbi:hypothetical protein ACIQPS_09255 [Streptomyces sp. NPDC091290]|uniref:hypothetical protein n=1 Tax=Streptomyces sp. NPDC091290 TaxID=3365990 RepID=UPI00382438E9